MALVTRGLMVVNMLDYNSEPAEHQLNGAVIGVGNIVAQTALRDAYLTALAAISSAAIGFYTLGNKARYEPQVAAASASAAREENWLVGLVDSVTSARATLRIPAPVPTNNLYSHSDRANLAATDMAAFVTALQAYALSAAGNAVTVSGIVRVGRNDRSPKSPFG